MTGSWATDAHRAAPDLHLDLDPAAPRGGLRAGLIRALRDAVRSGRLAPGTRLPSSRALAADLGMARNTVAEAYGQLVAEGWLTARRGSATRVAPGSVAPRGPAARTAAPPRPVERPPYDLRAGTSDVSAFPRTAWAAAARRALAAAPNEAFGYGDGHGRPELRAALAGYLARVRGVRADPAHIVVCSGFMQGVALLGRVLRRRGVRAIGVEDRGFWGHHESVERAGLRGVPLPVDALGADVTELDRHPGVGAVLLTPAHQFPTGVPLHPDRRTAVVDWAARTGGLVLEDDYDGEFRYDGRKVGALQSLAPDHVVHCGTVSKSLAPGLRLAWMVLPGELAGEVAALKATGEWGTGVLDQLTLAELIASGAYDRHVRSVRLRYRRRRDRLVAALADRAPHIGVTGIAAGLHVVLRLPPGTEAATVRAARERGVALEGLGRFRHPLAGGPDAGDGIVVAYGTPPDHAFSAALAALLEALPPEG